MKDFLLVLLYVQCIFKLRLGASIPCGVGWSPKTIGHRFNFNKSISGQINSTH